MVRARASSDISLSVPPKAISSTILQSPTAFSSNQGMTSCCAFVLRYALPKAAISFCQGARRVFYFLVRWCGQWIHVLAFFWYLLLILHRNFTFLCGLGVIRCKKQRAAPSYKTQLALRSVGKNPKAPVSASIPRGALREAAISFAFSSSASANPGEPPTVFQSRANSSSAIV